MTTVIERLDVEVTFSVPDWFGEGEDWERYNQDTWERYTGNHAWERLWAYLDKHGLQHAEDCTHPQGQWTKLSFDVDDMRQTGTDVQVAHGLLVAFFMNEEERRAKDSTEETGSADA